MYLNQNLQRRLENTKIVAIRVSTRDHRVREQGCSCSSSLSSAAAPKPQKFRSMVRMDSACFDTLCKILAPELEPAFRARVDSIRKPDCCFIALLWLGGAGPFTSLEQCTGRGATTCSQCVSDFCAAVCKVMSEKEITLPTAPEIKASADSFKEHTGMLGSASHIRILNLSMLLRRAGWKDVTFPDLQFMYSRLTFICPSQERLRCKNYVIFRMPCSWCSSYSVNLLAMVDFNLQCRWISMKDIYCGKTVSRPVAPTP